MTDTNDYDLFVTTIPTQISDKIFYFDISNFEQNFKDLKKTISSKQQKLQLFNLFSIKTFPSKLTKNQLIEDLSDELLQKGYVTETFSQDVLNRELISNTILDNIVAISHPINHSVKKKHNLCGNYSKRNQLESDPNKICFFISNPTRGY